MIFKIANLGSVWLHSHLKFKTAIRSALSSGEYPDIYICQTPVFILYSLCIDFFLNKLSNNELCGICSY